MTFVRPRLVLRDEVDPVRWNGEEGRFLLRQEDTGGLFSFMELTTAPGSGPPVHVHELEDEAFLVLEGRYEIGLDGERHLAEPGTLVFSPRGIAHEFRNITTAPAKMLLIVTPGGVEQFFTGLSRLFAGEQRPSGDEVLALAAAHRIRGFEAGPPGLGGGRPTVAHSS